MKKKTILVAAIAVMLVAALVVGGTLAYFTDKSEVKDNVFTVGNVDIELKENFEQNSKLLPATGSAQQGTLQNGVTKEISVESTGSEAAYVRVHIAIPSILDDGDPTFDAKNNVLHFNYTPDSIGENKWDWTKTTGAPYDGQDWNFYTTTIDGVKYNVYVVTYEKALAKGETTENAMHQVYLDSRVTSADMTKLTEALGTNWEIKVVAEGVQAAGFDNAHAALNTAFGTPGAYDAFAK